MKQKKILIIGHTNTMGGVETFIKNTTLYSDKKKTRFYFLIHGYDTCLFRDEINRFYGKNSFYFVPRFKDNPVKTVCALFRFYKKHHNFDFIHLQTGAAAEILYCFPYCLLYGIKVIVHSHNGGNLNSFFDHQAFRGLVKHITNIKLACSREAAFYMFGRKMGMKAKIVPVGIDINNFKFSQEKRDIFRKKYNLDEDKLIIGVVGRFTKQKNQDFAIKVFKEYHNINPDSVLILKGRGEMEGKLRKEINKSGAGQNILIINDLDDMSALYSALDLFFMPSLFEGLPQVSVEAQTAGLPCLFSNNISKEANITGLCTMLSLDDNIEKWVKAIELLVHQETDRNKGYILVKNKGYDIYDTVKILEDIYGV